MYISNLVYEFDVFLWYFLLQCCMLCFFCIIIWYIFAKFWNYFDDTNLATGSHVIDTQINFLNMILFTHKLLRFTRTLSGWYHSLIYIPSEPLKYFTHYNQLQKASILLLAPCHFDIWLSRGLFSYFTFVLIKRMASARQIHIFEILDETWLQLLCLRP